MSERQKFVLGAAAAALIIASMFFVPWRVESSDEITWAPIHRQPISYVRSYDGTYSDQGSSNHRYDEGEIAIDILVLEVLVIGIAGGTLFVLSSD